MSATKTELVNRLNNKQATIGIVGLGYVGLPLMLRYADIGFKVLGLDINQKKVDDLNQGLSDIEHIPHEKVAKAITQGFSATTDMSRSKE